MRAFGRFAKYIDGLAQHMEDRAERRVAEIVASVARGLDESNVMEGVSEDFVRGVAENYELVISEIRISLRRKTAG